MCEIPVEDIKKADDAWEHLNEIATNPTNPAWKLVKSKGNLTVYSRDSTIEGAPAEFRLDGIIPYPIKYGVQVFRASDLRTTWDKQLRVFDEV